MLNNKQLQAVESNAKYICLTAPPGSGKTKTLVERVNRLSSYQQPESILILSFSNAACQELKARIVNDINAMTFHSWSFSMIKKSGFYFSILDEQQIKRKFKEVAKDFPSEDIQKEFGFIKGDDNLDDDNISGIDLNAFGKARNLIALNKKEQYNNNIIAFVNQFSKALRDSKTIDFVEMQIFTLELLQSKCLSINIDTLLIDEFQDTDLVQYEILKQISSQSNCDIFIVGDPWQSIYGFRGANYLNMDKYIEDFNPKLIKLDINYRSCDSVINIANYLVGDHYMDGTSQFGNVAYDFFDSTNHDTSVLLQSNFVASEIRDLILNQSYKLSETAILVRNKYLMPKFELACIKKCIPVYVVGGMSIRDYVDVKFVMNWINICLDINNKDSFISVAEKFEGIGEKTAATKLISIANLQTNQALKVTPKVKKSIGVILELFEKLFDKAMANDTVGFLEVIYTYLGNNITQVFKVKGNKIKAKQNLLDINFKSLNELADNSFGIDEFITMLSMNDINANNRENSSVIISTIHAAKGKEWDVVFMPHMEDKIIPSPKGDYEEEKRLAFVGVTRARKKLYLTAGQKISRFFEPRF